MVTNLKLSDEYVPNVDYHFDRIDGRKPIKLDDVLEQLYELTGGGVYALIFQLGDEYPDELNSVDVYDTGMAAKLLVECDGRYLVDGQGNVLAGDRYRLREILTEKWGMQHDQR